MSEHVMVSVVVITLFTAASFMVATIVNAIGRSRRARYAADVQSKLIDRLGTGPDAMAYANTDAFKSLLGGNEDGRGVYATRVLNTLQSGIVLICAGIGLALTGRLDTEARLFLQVVSGIVIAVGFGLAISAGWSYVLLKRWGLLTEAAKPQ